jgi:plasmid stabilization system protein ParE
MRRSVTIDPEAARALEAARLWLLQPGSGAGAARRWEALRRAPRNLQRYPYLGPASQDFPGRRQIVVSRYRIIYKVDPDTGDSQTAGDIRIIAVFGPGQETRLP